MRITISNTKEAALLLLGDFTILFSALWLTLTLRYVEVPDQTLFLTHLTPFSFLFLVWFVIFFIAGLYDKHTLIFKEKLPTTILYAQLFNVVFAALFFFLIPYFGITPKTNLVIYLFVSFSLIVLWRLFFFDHLLRLLGGRKRQKALLIGSGPEIEELKEEVNNNSRYPFIFALHVVPEEIQDLLELQGQLLAHVSSGTATIIVGDSRSSALESLIPLLSNMAFMEIRFAFIDSTTLYENIFDKIPLSLIHPNWFLEYVSTAPQYVYDAIKRVMDITAGLILSIVMLLVYPLVALFIRLDDAGSVIFSAERVGKDNKSFMLLKFRSMSEGVDKDITRVGYYLRKLRIDELPQAWNLLLGDISLIGPRPELPRLVQQYAEQIPNYNIRHLIKPGLSGWAQIKEYDVPRGGVVDLDRTQTKLSYDLYYIKHRSLMLDVHIALKTLKTLASRSGS